MRVLVTGAGGLAGQAMVGHLLAAGGNLDVIALYRRDLPAPGDRFSAVKLDLLDRETTLARVREAEPSVILHLAGVNHGTLEELLTGNVTATRNLLEAACALGGPVRVIAAGSSAEYGYAGEGPIPESAPLRPVGPYGVSKVAADLLARSYALARGLPVAVVRPFNLVGPGQSDSYVCGKIVRQVAEIEAGKREEISLANVTQRRDFVDARDLAPACWTLASLPDFGNRCAGKAFNVGSGKDHSVGEVIEMVKKITGRHFPVALSGDERHNPDPMPVPAQRSDNSLIMATCDWKPSISLIRSLRDMLAYERERAG